MLDKKQSIAAPGSSVQLSANISAICVFLDGFHLPRIHHWTPTASLSRYPCSGQPDILTISALGNYRTPRSTGVLYSSSWSQTWFKYSNMKLSFVSRPDGANTLILCISSLSPADKNHYKRWWSICHSTSGLKHPFTYWTRRIAGRPVAAYDQMALLMTG